jgi:hypothetical protein
MFDRIKENARRAALATGLAGTLIIVGAGNALAVEGDAADVLTDAATSTNGTVLTVAAVVLGFAGGLLAIKVGWAWVRRFVR